MPESLLTILKFTLVALLWLFFLRVLRAVWAEITRPPAPSPAAPAPAAAEAPTRVLQARTPAGQSPSKSAVLRLVEPKEARGRTYEVGEEVTVGRASGCGVSLAGDTFVSQLHARLYRRDGRTWVEDLGSTNGTYVNSKRLTSPVSLRRGDRVQVGRTVLELTR
ncbi:MAG: FHA domain-containing protein [Actinobacteria bacterium]|nr:MAG: FHA domain-containing protein [Actinomycetota bacterium]